MRLWMTLLMLAVTPVFASDEAVPEKVGDIGLDALLPEIQPEAPAAVAPQAQRSHSRRPASAPVASTVKSAVQEYVVKAGDTLSTVLYAMGVRPLYGKRGWVRRNMARNGDVTDWQRLKPGQKLVLVLPESGALSTAQAPVRKLQPPRGFKVKAKMTTQRDSVSDKDVPSFGRSHESAPRCDIRTALRQRPVALRPPGRCVPSG